MNFLRQGFRKLSSDRQTEQTDTIEIIYHAASPGGQLPVIAYLSLYVLGCFHENNKIAF